jgi:hypothetical protein
LENAIDQAGEFDGDEIVVALDVFQVVTALKTGAERSVRDFVERTGEA